MAWKQPITYDIMQDVQYHNNIEITSYVSDGERFYRAYSLFNAAAKDSINRSIRSAMISRLGRMAEKNGGGILMARFKSPNAWFLSSRLLRFAVDTASPIDERDNRRRKQGDWHDYEISDLTLALALAEKLDVLPADPTPWPVAIVGDYADTGQYRGDMDDDQA